MGEEKEEKEQESKEMEGGTGSAPLSSDIDGNSQDMKELRTPGEDPSQETVDEKSGDTGKDDQAETGKEEKEEKEDLEVDSNENRGEPGGELEEEDIDFDLDGISLDEPGTGEEEEKELPEKRGEEKRDSKNSKVKKTLEGWKSGIILDKKKAVLAGALLMVPVLALLLMGLPGGKGEKVAVKKAPLDNLSKKKTVYEAMERKFLPTHRRKRNGVLAEAEKKAVGGDLTNAIVMVEKYLASHENLTMLEKSDAWYLLSSLYRRIGDRETARKYFSKALDISWSSLGPRELFLGGKELHKAGRYRKARRYLSAFLLEEGLMIPSLKRKISEAWYLLAEGYRLEAEKGLEKEEEDAKRVSDAVIGGER